MRVLPMLSKMTSEERQQKLPVIRHSHKHNLKNRFELVKTLGQGTYGKVKLAIERSTGEEVAIKSIKKRKIDNEQDLARIRREIDIMSSLHHPYIINIREVFENREKIILVMEYASGGELYDYVNNRRHVDENEARRFFHQIVSAVHYCHKKGIAHRDLKLENILLDCCGNVKIADFGLSNLFNHDHLLKTFCGSPLYASPEIVNGLPYYGPEVDCWSVGVLLYTLVYGAMPFDGSDFRKLRKQISEGDYYEPSKPSDASGLISHLLTIDPAKRATVDDVMDHWWLNLHCPADEGYASTLERRGNLSVTASSDDEFEEDSLLENARKQHTSNCITIDGAINKNSDSVNNNSSPCNSFSDGSCTNSSTSTIVDPKDSLSNTPKTPSPRMLSKHSTRDVFDSRKQPKRSILKKKGKYSGSDSGCVLEDHRAAINESGSQPDSTPSSPTTASDEIPKIISQGKYNKWGAAADTIDALASPTSSPTEEIIEEPADFNYIDSTPNVVVRRRGILKKHSKYDQTKRYSLGSQSSNSSADLLDFSLDGLDSEDFSYYSNNQYEYGSNSTLTDSGFHSDINSMAASNINECSLHAFDAQLPKDDIMKKISRLGDESDSSPVLDRHVFSLAEQQSVYKQALEFCNS